ncbi:Hypothetical predicted protein, partial [Pelobates cultripes]
DCISSQVICILQGELERKLGNAAHTGGENERDRAMHRLLQASTQEEPNHVTPDSADLYAALVSIMDHGSQEGVLHAPSPGCKASSIPSLLFPRILQHPGKHTSTALA